MFSVNGKFFTVLSKIGDLFILNVLWIIGCLPVVTIVTSTASLYHCCIKCVRRDRSSVGKEFWRAYKMNLVQGIFCTLILAVLVFLALMYYSYAGAVIGGMTGTTKEVAFVIGLVVYSVLLLSFAATVPPMLSRFSLKFGKFLELSFLVGLRHVLRTVFVGAVLVLAFYITLGNFLMLLFLPAFLAFLATFIYEPILVKYMPREQAEQGDNWYFEGEDKKEEKRQAAEQRANVFSTMRNRNKKK